MAGAATVVPTSLWGVARSAGVPRSVTKPQTHLPGSQIPQFVDPLPTFVGARVDSPNYESRVSEFQQAVLPASVYAGATPPFDGGTFVWGIRNGGERPSWPGHTTIAHRGRPTTVTYVNDLPAPGDSQLEPFLTMDQTLMWANPENDPMTDRDAYQGVVPTVFHLHGMEVNSEFDGTMMEWFTNNGIHGPGYNTLHPTAPNAAVYRYPNTQPGCTLFFHDHARGLTRTNVYAGMVSQYWLRDDSDTGEPDNPLGLPAGDEEIELIIQDRMFDTNGQLFYPDNDPANSHVHPFWAEEFFGDVMCVNGRSWPFLDVEPRRYRFRMHNFSNMRCIQVWLENAASGAAGPPIWQIGTDGGLLDAPVKLSTDGSDEALFGNNKLGMCNTERADVIVDFTGLGGQTFTLRNDQGAPLGNPDPENLDPATTGRIMQFRVNQPLSSPDRTFDPASGGPLRGGPRQLPTIVRLAEPDTGKLASGVKPSVTRQLIIVEAENDDGSMEYLLNNMTEDGTRQGTTIPIPGTVPDRQKPKSTGLLMTETPRVGDTEVWEIFNLSDVGHVIHIHLIQYQVLNRQEADVEKYTDLYNSSFPGGGPFFGADPTTGAPTTLVYPAGTYIPGYGPPADYDTPNADGAIGGNPAFSPFLGTLHPPDPFEQGWKDSFHVLPGVVNRLVARFSPQDVAVGGVQAGENLYAIDPTTGPGYMFHCHMLEHEDNALMHAWLCNP